MREKREFNFADRWVSELVRETRDPLKWKMQVVLWGSISLLLLCILGGTPWIWEYKVRLDIAKVEQQISSLGEIANQVKRVEDLKNQAEVQRKLLDLMQKSTRDPAPILEKLKKTLPVGTVVNTFSLQANDLTLGVSVPTPVDVARLWISLRDTGLFQEVDIKTVSLQDKVQTLNFKLKFK